MAGHHPFAELRAGIDTDPARAGRLAAAKRQIAEEQADVARIECHAALYLSTLQSCLQAMGAESELLLTFSAGPTQFQLTDLLPLRTPADEFAAPATLRTGSS